MVTDLYKYVYTQLLKFNRLVNKIDLWCFKDWHFDYTNKYRN